MKKATGFGGFKWSFWVAGGFLVPTTLTVEVRRVTG
ncbi:hypothetical protein GGC04_27380 (plasmid) [Vibrio sp. THAF191d]|nr:hypothetical protein FIU99_27175 [Vibrio sp. THAF64]QGM38022.1 hypothetical protein GGC04_27380 [Vibrio sp. THAF191d]